MPSGFTTETADSIAYDVAVVSYDSGAGRVALGISKGGTGFMPGVEYRQPEFDGRRHMIAGFDRVVGYASKIEGTFIEFSDALTAALMPGGTTAGTTTTPPDAGTSIAVGDLLLSPRFTLIKADGSSEYYEGDYGLVTKWEIKTKDKEEAEIELTIEFRVDSTAEGYTTDAPDFRRVTVAA
jgi:hypothetical protein